MSVGPAPEEWEHDDLDDAGLDIDVLRRRRERVLTFLALAFVLGAALFVTRSILKPRPVVRTELIAAAKDAVRNEVPAGTVLEFGGAATFVIEMESEDRYSVAGEFVMVSSAAQASHYYFKCTLRREAQGPWLPARLTITAG